MVETYQHNPEFSEDDNYLAVCLNGRTRSKYIAKCLDRMGYPNCRSLGIRDFELPEEDKRKILANAEVIICASPDTYSEVSNFLEQEAAGKNPQLISLDIPEELHGSVRLAMRGSVGRMSNFINEQLLAHGFTPQGETAQ